MNDLYALLSPALCEGLLHTEEEVAVPAGTVLISHSVAPEYLIFIQQGSVEISVQAGEKAMPVRTAGAGQVLGLRAIVSGTLPEIEATALQECGIRRIPRQAFLEIVEQHPELYLAICKLLSADLNAAERFLRDAPRSAGKEKNRLPDTTVL